MAKPTRYTQEMIEEHIKRGEWDYTTNAYFWDRNAELYPDKEAVVDSRNRLTWAQAKQCIDRIALGLLELDIKRDEAVVLQLPNIVEVPLLRIACEKAGILGVQVMRTFRHHEVEHTLKYVEAVGVVIPWEFAGFNYFQMIEEIRPNLPALRHIFIVGDEVPPGTISIKEMSQQPLEEKYPGDYLEKKKYGAMEVSLVTATTGTTGLPKFVENPICSRICIGKQMANMVRLSSDDVVAVTTTGFGGPLLLALHGAPILAAKIVMQERFVPEETLRLIEKERVSVLHFFPTQALAMAQHPNLKEYDLSSLRVISIGGATLTYSQAVEIEEKLGVVVMNGYGAHDCGVSIHPSLDDRREVRLLTVGKPDPGCGIKLLDDAGEEVARGEVGKLWATGPGCVSGYYKDPEATWQAWTEDGWFRTGDLGRLDEDGNLIIVGREKDMIKRGGQNIYPVEIESLLVSHPKVLDVAIVGMPDPLMLEKACAYVIPQPGQQLTFEEMVSFLKEKKIASFKLPERLEIVDKFPLAAEQKVSKKALQQDIINKLMAEGKL